MRIDTVSTDVQALWITVHQLLALNEDARLLVYSEGEHSIILYRAGRAFSCERQIKVVTVVTECLSLLQEEDSVLILFGN